MSHIIDTSKHLLEKDTGQRRESGAPSFTPMLTLILAEILRKSRPREKQKTIKKRKKEKSIQQEAS